MNDIRHWPKNIGEEIDMEAVNQEKRKSVFTITINHNHLLEAICKVSSHMRRLRFVAYLFRFSNALKRLKGDIAPPTPQELCHSFHCLAWNLQQQYFVDEIKVLKKGGHVTSQLKWLNPFLEECNGFLLLKVGGRLDAADLPYRQKHPILLPSKLDIILHYVQHLHRNNCHAGPKALVALIRLEVWIINARDVARRVVRSCVHCVRYKPRLEKQIMGHLPVERLTPARPFARCGVDFCGPISTFLRIRGKGPYKSYIAIFICFVTKAIHIEIVTALTTDAFIAALKRMVARRGLPTDIYCDNATNFVGASNKLAELKAFMFKRETQDSITTYCSNEFINFHFIPSRAPHFGGLWEAAVKSAKGLLNRTMMNARLTYEELCTVGAEVEAILNSRPLSPSSSDPSDLAALTPGHFLIGEALRAIPEQSITTENVQHLEHWNRIAAIKQQFWRRWSYEYITELQTRVKWNSEAPNIAQGTMVIIHEDNVPPQRWSLGRIEAIIRGRDERVRVVDVRTAKGIIRRPVHKVAILPVN